MATERQLATVSRHVNDAVSNGASVHTGGKPRDGGLLGEPTALVDVDHGMDFMRGRRSAPRCR